MSVQSVWEFLEDPNRNRVVEITRRKKYKKQGKCGKRRIHSHRYQVIVTTPDGETKVHGTIHEAASSHNVSYSSLREKFRTLGVVLIECQGTIFEYRPLENEFSLPFFSLGPPESPSPPVSGEELPWELLGA